MHTHPNKSFFFFFNDTATTEIYTLSLHDALPISGRRDVLGGGDPNNVPRAIADDSKRPQRVVAELSMAKVTDRKSTRLNSSHGYISYAVFCLKKKKKLQSHKV